MNVNEPRDASSAFSHYDTINGEKLTVEIMAEGLDADDGTITLFNSDSKDKNSFERVQDETPVDLAVITMNEKSSGAFAGASSADAGASTQFTTATHGLTTGEFITIEGTTDYNGLHEVTVVDVNNFKITVPFVDSQAGTWKKKTYKYVKINNFYHRYLRADWAPVSNTTGKVQVKSHVTRTEGIFR